MPLAPSFRTLSALCRSLALLYFFAVVRAFAGAAGLRRAAPKGNAAVRRVRQCVHGAPLWLAFAVVAHLLPACSAMNSPPSPMRPDPPGPPASGPCETHPPGCLQPVREGFRATSAADDMRAQALMFMFQRSSIQASGWVGPNEGTLP